MKKCVTCKGEHNRGRLTCSTECSKAYLTKKANAKRYKKYMSDSERPEVSFKNRFLLGGL